MNKSIAIHTKYDLNKHRIVNANGTSDFWRQIDTDTIISPKQSRYGFYLMGEQDLDTGEWKFYYHDAKSGARSGDALATVNTPTAAQKWYYAQR